MPRIFLSYRRSDSALAAQHLYTRLISRFGKRNVFKDIDNIPIGSDFRAVIEHELITCDVMLVLIGRGWLTATDDKGNRRLDNPEDFVRTEVELGLRHRKVRLIPVLIDNAQMPSEADLPTRLKPLAFQNAAGLRNPPDLDRDIDRLISAIAPATHWRMLRILAMFFSIALVSTVVLALIRERAIQQSITAEQTLSTSFTDTQAATTFPTFTLPALAGSTPTSILTVTQETSTAVEMSPEDCIAVIQVKGTVIMYDSPVVTGSPVEQLEYTEQVSVKSAAPQSLTSADRWIFVKTFSGISGWIPDEYVGYRGDCTLFGVDRRYPAPITSGAWLRGFNTNGNSGPLHSGWDFSASTGETVFNPVNAGTVVEVYTCTKCTVERPNGLSQGISLNNPSVLQDPGWSYGYGHAVVVAYPNADLPEVTREELIASAWGTSDVMCIYSQLNTIAVEVGDQLTERQLIGTVGNTGNSSAPHLHLECRLLDGEYSDWFTAHRIDPGAVFNRLIPVLEE